MEPRNRYYIDGNTVRRQQEEQEQQLQRRREELSREEEALRRELARRRAVDPRPRLGYVLLMAFSSLLLAAMCYGYIRVRSVNNELSRQTASIQAETSSLRVTNDLNEHRLEVDLDMSEVYRIATEQLGMVYPKDNEVIAYSGEVREYVHQNEAIPG